MDDGSVCILHTNDLHGTLDDRRLEALRAPRKAADLYFDTGDCIKTGNLGVPLKAEPVWGRLSELGCTASVPGNRESHVLKSAFEAKLAGRQHPVVCANMYERDGSRVFAASLVTEVGAMKIGIVGAMIPMVTERMKSKALSQFLWTDPLQEAIKEGERLTGTVDLLILLSHIGFKQDQILATKTEVFDIILGGHSHTVLETPVKVNRTWICQGGSHGRFYGQYNWSQGTLEGGLKPWLS